MSTQLSARDEFLLAVWMWVQALERISEPYRATVLAKAWLRGLKAAGINADHPKRFEGGKYRGEYELAVQFTCPHGHRAANRGTYAQVRLIIEDDGWPTIAAESPCEHCNDDALVRWLLICPRCRAGEDSARHRPGHGLRQADGRTREGPALLGSVAPLAFVVTEFAHLLAVAEATWWLEHEEQARAALEAEKAECDERGDEDCWFPSAEWHIDRAQRTRDTITIAPPKTQRKTWTPESAAAWLDGLTDADGQPLVPATLAQRPAIAKVKHLAGAPSHNMIGKAQTLRKQRAGA